MANAEHKMKITVDKTELDELEIQIDRIIGKLKAASSFKNELTESKGK